MSAIGLHDTAVLHCMEEKKVSEKRAVAFDVKQSYDYEDVFVPHLQELKASLLNMPHRRHES